jgi:hypothetical protein
MAEQRTLFQFCKDKYLENLNSIFLDHLVSGLFLGQTARSVGLMAVKNMYRTYLQKGTLAWDRAWVIMVPILYNHASSKVVRSDRRFFFSSVALGPAPWPRSEPRCSQVKLSITSVSICSSGMSPYCSSLRLDSCRARLHGSKVRIHGSEVNCHRSRTLAPGWAFTVWFHGSGWTWLSLASLCEPPWLESELYVLGWASKLSIHDPS